MMSGQRLDPVSHADIVKARKRLQQVIAPTPLLSMWELNNAVNRSVYVKAESLLPVGSFKLRGAYNKISSLSEEEKKRGIVTASAGNHAMGVSLACKWLNGEATVVVPKTAPETKKSACLSMGAKVIEYGQTYDDAYKEARRIENESGRTYIHSVADADIIAGQGTVGLEILEQLPNVKQIVVPLGGGGLVSGIAIAVKSLNPSIKVIGVQPAGSSVYYQSIKENKAVELTHLDTIADGLAVKKVELYTLNLIKKWVDEVVVVREETIKKAIKLQLLKGKLVVEGAGGAALAAVMEDLVANDDETVIIASGGNIDQSKLIDILEG
ncbi:threonine/serine dehydratase [bacterium LRH843]|nr:threonine/serine dehydratase [bacterium LRH843]